MRRVNGSWVVSVLPQNVCCRRVDLRNDVVARVNVQEGFRARALAYPASVSVVAVANHGAIGLHAVQLAGAIPVQVLVEARLGLVCEVPD